MVGLIILAVVVLAGLALWQLSTPPRGQGKASSGVVQPPTVWVDCVLFHPDGKTLVTAKDVMVTVWDAPSAKELRSFKAHEGQVASLAFSQDGKRLATASSDKTFKIWDFDQGTELAVLKGHTASGAAVALSKDGHTAATAAGIANPMRYVIELKLWDWPKAAPVADLSGHGNVVTSLLFLPDGYLVTASRDGTVRVWDIAKKAVIKTINCGSPVSSLALAPDGKTLAAGLYSNEIPTWDVGAWKEKRRLQGHADRVNAVAVSRDGKTLASASDDRTIKLWDLNTGKNLATLEGHKNFVTTVSFGADGILASGSADSTIKLWDTAGGKERATLNK